MSIGSFKIPVTASGGGDSGYTRPADWLTLPTVSIGDQLFAGLFAVYMIYEYCFLDYIVY